jgi:8-oxo-dGTP pyrophosphatase MutT (NUDIX family)
MKAAGILFISSAGKALFLRRTASVPDCPGCWDFPGGGQEGEETAEQTARRECREEIGFVPDGILLPHTRTKSGSALKGVAGPAAPVVGIPVDAGAAATDIANPSATSTAIPMAKIVAIGEAAEGVDYSTFLQRVTNEFTPELNDEHDGFCWSPIDAPPEPLHPGCRIALDRLGMNELDVARAIAAGELTSPQRYENVTLWALRISGIGASFRPKHEEFVHRDGENWLTPDAVARCNGLPVILKHPKKALLDSEEFGKRIVGTIFLPYVAGDELWGVAKIYDDETNKLLIEEDLSTSPGVNFSNPKVNRVLHVEEVGKVLIEGDPSLFDHVAICQLGVWDKGEEPSGIRSEAREDSAMADEKTETKEEEKKADAVKDDAKKDAKSDAKKDESEGEKKEEGKDDARKDAKKDEDQPSIMDALKAIGDTLGGLGKRMDAWEEGEKKRDDARKDAKKDETDKETGAEKTAADKKDAKKDAKDDAKADARADSLDPAVLARIAKVEAAVQNHSSMIVPLSDDDHSKLADAWARADDACVALGVSTPRAMPGESSMRYRRRAVKLLQPYSPTWGKVDLDSKAYDDEATFNIAESQIFAQAAEAAKMPINVKPGELRMTERKRDGHIVREFRGEPRDWMDQFAGQTGLKATGKFLHDNLGNRAN